MCKILSSGFLLGLLDVENTKMAVTVVADATREAAFTFFKAEFTTNGRLLQNSVVWSYFMPGALFGNPAFSQISDF